MKKDIFEWSASQSKSKNFPSKQKKPHGSSPCDKEDDSFSHWELESLGKSHHPCSWML